jgi:uncharacterized membrane protein
MTALVALATMVFTMYIPTTSGFFNIGESMIYVTAIVFGPGIGAFAGGVGSAMADLLLGYSIYAPGTLVIKGLEGFVVGALYRRLSSVEFTRAKGKRLSLGLSLGTSILIGVAGAVISQGEVWFGGAIYEGLYLWEFVTPGISTLMWVGVAVAAFVVMAFISLRRDADFSRKVIPMLVGGFVIVLGYYLYARFALFIALAHTEILSNFLQCWLGIFIALPVIEALEKGGASPQA